MLGLSSLGFIAMAGVGSSDLDLRHAAIVCAAFLFGLIIYIAGVFMKTLLCQFVLFFLVIYIFYYIRYIFFFHL